LGIQVYVAEAEEGKDKVIRKVRDEKSALIRNNHRRRRVGIE
jgi:hypothetical protein